MFSCLLQLPFLLRMNLTAKATNSITKATNSIANGTNSIAKATNSIANGTNSIAKAMNSIANGTNSIAKATNSIANGTNSIAKATNSIANATNSIANGMNSIAKATNSIANGTNSIAKATNSIAKATNSIANGTNSIAKSPNSIAKTCKDRTEIAQIDDLDEVARNEVQLPGNTIKEADIVGVFSIEHFSVCLKCNGKVLGEEEFGTCNRCGMLQCMDICNRDVVGKIMIKGREDSVVLKAYGTVLKEIVGEEEITGLDSISLL